MPPGLPIRFGITPGQWGDCPQAPALLEGLTGVGHLVECFFNRIKRFRRIALRCEKTVSSFSGLCFLSQRHGVARLNDDAA